MVAYSVVVMSARLNPMGSQYLFPLYEICVRNQWDIKLWMMEYVLAFQY